VKLSAQVGDRSREVVVEPLPDGRFRVAIDGVERVVDARRIAPGTWSLLLGDEAVTVDVDPGKDGDLLVDVRGVVVPVKLLDARRHLLAAAQVRGRAHAGPTPIAAPMPGKVVKLLVAEGDAVTAGQTLMVLEAMKMEHAVKAVEAGTVARLAVAQGEQVESGALLAVVSPVA
jgi:glutaconyl-CoA/methylmalonyl-CoA decarboxylase subunit gamma